MSWFINPAVPRVLTRIAPERLELAMIFMKERRKRVRYLGSMYQHFGDRSWMYSLMGGYNGSKIILQKTTTRHQYYHPGMYSRLGNNTWSVRSIKLKGTQYDGLGGYTRSRWDQNLCTTNGFNESGLKYNFRGMDKNQCIEFLEQWGLKYVIVDELTKPTLGDMFYTKHKLYTHNFPWIRNPVTNHRVGDADHDWKGEEKLDYTNYGATAKVGNSFKSLWLAAAEEAVAAPVVVATASKKKEKASKA